MQGIDLLVHDTHEGSGGQWLKLCRFQSSNLLELLPRVFLKLLYQSFLSEISQKLLHVRSRTLASQIIPLPLFPLVPLATATSPVNGISEFASPFGPAGYLRRIWSQHALIHVGDLGHKTPLRGKIILCSRVLSCGPEVDISQQVNTRQCTYLALIARNK